MRENYPTALAAVLRYEGGYSNHPADPGGATMKGVTQATYDAWRSKHGLSHQSVRSISQDEVEQIYRRDYWDRIHGDDLPSGLDLCVFDYAVNSGPSRAARALQKVLGVRVDGIIGPETLAAANAHPKSCGELCDARLAFMQRLKTWPVFGKGWGARVAGVKKTSLALAAKAPAVPVVVGKAIPHEEEKSIFDGLSDFFDWTKGESPVAQAPTQRTTPSPAGQIGYIAAAIIAAIGALNQISGAEWEAVISTPSHEGLNQILIAVALTIVNALAPPWIRWALPTPRLHK
jgi:lysozyme family protein